MSDSKEDGVVVEKPQEQENTTKRQGPAPRGNAPMPRGIAPSPSKSSPPERPGAVMPQSAKPDQEIDREERDLDRRIKEAKVRANKPVIKLSPEIQGKIDNMRKGIEEARERGEMDVVKANEQKLKRGVSKAIFARAEEMDSLGMFSSDNPGADKWLDEKGQRKNQVRFSEKEEVHTYPRLKKDSTPEAPAFQPAFTDPRPYDQEKRVLPPVTPRAQKVNQEVLATQPPEAPIIPPRFTQRFSGEDIQQLEQIRQNPDLGSMRRDVSREGRRLTLVPVTPRNKDHAPTVEILPPAPPKPQELGSKESMSPGDKIRANLEAANQHKPTVPALEPGKRRQALVQPLNQRKDGGRSM